MQTLKNIQTKDYIAQAIRNEILSGNIEPEEELAQETLAQMLGVSRMPVREALQTLVQEGFAVRLPNRHIQAVVPDTEQLHDIFRVIAVMEAEYLIIGAERGAGLEELQRLTDKLKDTEDSEEKIRMEKAFHELVLKLPGNVYLEQLEKRAVDGYAVYAMENFGEKNQVLIMLENMVLAAEKRDEAAVRRQMKEYYQMYADEFARRWNR